MTTSFVIHNQAELNAAIQEEWPAPVTHAHRLRLRLKEKAQEKLLDKERNRTGEATPAGPPEDPLPVIPS